MNNRHAALLDIMCLANCLSRELGALNAERSSAGISRVNAQILEYLVSHEECDVFQKDIEEEFSIRRSTVSKVVRLMEMKGLIQREAVAQDARLKRLMLTDRAREIHRVASGEFAAFEERATKSLSDGEVQTLRTLLEKISCSLKPDNNEGNV
ncbi:MAG: MarR family winged helix-turn-helix transcriptional regulator [Candidatus Faecivicinus sp.]